MRAELSPRLGQRFLVSSSTICYLLACSKYLNSFYKTLCQTKKLNKKTPDIMIHPDPEVLGLNRKQEYDEIIIDIMTHEEGDLFLTDDMIDFHLRKDPTPNELEMYMNLVEESNNKFNFALIFQNCMRGTAWACSSKLKENNIDPEVVQSDLRTNFISRYKYIIYWLWVYVKKYNMWSPIRFLGSLATSLLMKKSN